MIWPGFVDDDCALQVSCSSTYDMLGPGQLTSLLPVKSRRGLLLTHWLRAACEHTPITQCVRKFWELQSQIQFKSCIAGNRGPIFLGSNRTGEASKPPILFWYRPRRIPGLLTASHRLGIQVFVKHITLNFLQFSHFYIKLNHTDTTKSPLTSLSLRFSLIWEWQ